MHLGVYTFSVAVYVYICSFTVLLCMSWVLDQVSNQECCVALQVGISVALMSALIRKGIAAVQDFVRRKHKHIPIEVETRTLDEVRQVLQFLETDKHSLVKRLMLDNMTKLDPSAPGTRHKCTLLLR